MNIICFLCIVGCDDGGQMNNQKVCVALEDENRLSSFIFHLIFMPGLSCKTHFSKWL